MVFFPFSSDVDENYLHVLAHRPWTRASDLLVAIEGKQTSILWEENAHFCLG